MMNNIDEIREREERFRIIAENTLDTIVLVNREAVVEYVSPSIKMLSGYSEDEYEGMDAFDIIHPEDRDRVREIHAEAVRHRKRADLEYRIVHADGRVMHIEARVKPVLNDMGEVKYVVAVARDVTERKKAEELLENILDNVNAAVWSTDKDFTRYTFCSRSMANISGIPRDEFISSPIRLHDHIHPEDNEALMGEVRLRLDQGLPVRRAIRFIHVEGEERWGRLIVHPWLNHKGEVERLDGLIMDITDKVRSELALEESEQRYKSLFEHNLDGVFSIELNGFYFVNANPAFEFITGMKLERLKGHCFLGVIHDEDHPVVFESLLKVMQQGKPTHTECRLVRSGQEDKIVSITFVPIFLSGSLHGIHGIVKDITKRKIEERELIRSEERYKFLQQSLSSLSHDLSAVMKVSELEQRLTEEVRAVLQVDSVSVEEVPRGQEAALMDSQDMWIPIGEKREPVYLRIAMGHELIRIEREWLETVVRYVTLLYDNLNLIEDLMSRIESLAAAGDKPKWMLRLLFKLSEKERASLSGDLHDSVLQDLIIWYRKLESLRSAGTFEHSTQQELKQIEEGLLDAIHQIRITCNELRPPFLLKLGLAESLKSLFEYTRMFAHYEIEFRSEPSGIMLGEEQTIGMYRVVQELLNNASKHSKADKVTMSLNGSGEQIHFSYSDNGVGMDLSAFEGSFQHMGIAGIEKRVQSLEGTVEIWSAPQQGFHVTIRLPKM
ncbi:PAS domain S-box protein [Paenibacillus hamazuiensis]|uniref:sensor histidine kinase n=1 Tax=Paenibacillus hamazuiensis TaxID=2936508 RepID=UPI00201020E8|nr:PAS domain S-box protein [Paenibacillus hamazuiensis]